MDVEKHDFITRPRHITLRHGHSMFLARVHL